MVLDPGKTQSLSLRGEIVETLETQGQYFAKIAVETGNILDVTAASIEETHLGDYLVIQAHITIESVKPE